MLAEDPASPVVATNQDEATMAANVIMKPKSMTETGIKTTGLSRRVSWATMMWRTLPTLQKLHNHDNKVWIDVDMGCGVKDLDRGFREGKETVK